MNYRRLVIGGITAVALVGGGGAVALEVRDNIREQQSCEVVQQFLDSQGEIIKTASGSPTVAIVGDSYTAGDQLQDREDGWVYQIGEESGWAVYAAGVGMTGFVNEGYCGDQQYSERLDSLITETNPELLIIQGGLNDWQASAEDLRSAANNLLERASQQVEQVAIVGPTPAPQRDNLQMVDRVLSDVAAEHGVQYISALGWDLPFLPDRLHLTPAGHKEFAERVRQAVAPI